MKQSILQTKQLIAYGQYLVEEECSPGTIEKYLRDTRAFIKWLNGREVTKELAVDWKQYLLEKSYAPVTINSMISSLNGLFKFLGWDHYRIKFLRIQRRLFRDSSKELTRSEYNRLLTTAQKQGKERLALLMETICSTGIRVSEIKYITIEAARRGKVEITLKGKVRVILLSSKLCRKLLKYAKKQKITFGAIFRTKSGNQMNRRQIWAEMKGLCKAAQIEPTKVFPHNLRHLFAVIFYKSCKDIVQLADLLGHSSIETTRIYLITSIEEHQRQLEQLGLVS